MEKQPSLFDEFMLQERQLFIDHGRHVATRDAQSEQFYLTAITALSGGLVVLLSQAPDPGSTLNLVTLALLLIVLFGTYRIRKKLLYFQASLRLKSWDAAHLHYFQIMDPGAFRQSGKEIELRSLEEPYYWLEFSKSPLKKIQLVGAFASIHGLLFGLGLSLLAFPLLQSLPPLLAWPLLSVVGATSFLLYVYWIAARTQTIHQRARHLHEQLLAQINDRTATVPLQPTLDGGANQDAIPDSQPSAHS